jgi:hypothetical protein
MIVSGLAPIAIRHTSTEIPRLDFRGEVGSVVAHPRYVAIGGRTEASFSLGP